MSPYSASYQADVLPTSSYERLPLLELRRDRRPNIPERIRAAFRALTPPENRRALQSKARHLGHDYHCLIEASPALREDRPWSSIRKWIIAIPSPPLQESFHPRAARPGSRSLDMALRALTPVAADLSLEDRQVLRLECPHPARDSLISRNMRMPAQDHPNPMMVSAQDAGLDACIDAAVRLSLNSRLNNVLPASNDFDTDNAGPSGISLSNSSLKLSAAMPEGVSNDGDPFSDPVSSGTGSSDTGYSSPAPSIDIDSFDRTGNDNCKRHGRIFTAQDISNLNLVLGIAPQDPVDASWMCDLHAFHGGFERCCTCGQEGDSN